MYYCVCVGGEKACKNTALSSLAVDCHIPIKATLKIRGKQEFYEKRKNRVCLQQNMFTVTAVLRGTAGCS